MEELQNQKLQLEIDKLNADIEKLNSSWYNSADFWKSIVPPFLTTAAVLASLYFTVGRSVLDDEKRKLELQKEQLKLEVMQFEGVKIDIQKQISVSRDDKKVLNGEVRILENQKNMLNQKTLSLQKQYNSLKNINNKLLFNHSDDTAFYHKELKKTYNESKRFFKRVEEKQREVDDKEVQLAIVIAENKFLNTKIKLSHLDRNFLEIEKNKAAADEHGKQARRWEKQAEEIRKIESDYKKKTNKPMSQKELQRWFELYFLGRQELDY